MRAVQPTHQPGMPGNRHDEAVTEATRGVHISAYKCIYVCVCVRARARARVCVCVFCEEISNVG